MTIARSGLSAANLRMDSAAHNIANALTAGFRRQQVMQQAQAGGGVLAFPSRSADVGANLASDMVDQRAAVYAFKANLQVIETHDNLLGRLLDARA